MDPNQLRLTPTDLQHVARKSQPLEDQQFTTLQGPSAQTSVQTKGKERYYFDATTTVEQATQLSIFNLKEYGLLCGYAATTLMWTRRLSAHESSIGTLVDTGELYAKFNYTIKDRSKGERTDYDYEISLTTTPAICDNPLVNWQHCTFHRLSTLRAAIGATDYRDLMVAEAVCIFRCESFEAALDVAGAWRQRWQGVDLWAVEQFLYGLRDSLRFYESPKRWWKRVRTNNALERLIRTLPQRLRPMACLHDEKAIERPAFGQLL